MNVFKRMFLIISILSLAISLAACERTPVNNEVSCEEDPTQAKCEITCEEDPTQEKCQEPVEIPPCKAMFYNYDEENLVYDLVFEDEFSIDGYLDPNNWRFEVGGDGWGNQELQYYTDGENIEIRDDMLIITARNEEKEGNTFTSARIVSRFRQDFKYGKFEIFAMVPAQKGTWSAFWMMPKNGRYGPWPRSGEIDIMEHVGYADWTVHGTIHTARFNHKSSSGKGYSYSFDYNSLEGPHQIFHKYSVEWLPDKIKWYVDDVLQYTYDPVPFSPYSAELGYNCPTKDEWPFDEEFYMIMNLAVGGDWGGAQGVSAHLFPASMYIEYVRVYQSEEITNLEQSLD